ncbi:glucose-1-phosphate thymidylyltransferase RfbA [Streptomyces echinoruber]|uniref:Glucose-1-phosphate thymidylyltransferase n=2 Tax=Streptomyces TaxID=1883 RepID=A0A918RGX6_9ACTN|nr:glucose-1-phosphate thymidylyltransferase RfbA [Streptomyces echinoruber]AOZ61197.1 Glucose-1-phosphate thymidylyltransferase [Streptomyces sp. KIB-H033]GGZ97328.1 glucose-1-phosphate thymidylyltransferase [Streptomyces echinoruber]
MKGIILAGGTGSRLHPLTMAMSKQLLPVYDKPMIYYPLSTLMLGGVREILVISTPTHLPLFRQVLGDGSELGLDLRYAEQPQPAGIADAFRIGARFLGADPVTLILGDNIFYGQGLSELLQTSMRDLIGCTLFSHTVRDPQRYGVAEFDAEGRLVDIEEKPARPKSSEAITGLYLYTNDVVEIARGLAPSARGELEITDVNRVYISEGRARLRSFGRGFAWLDAGTHDGLLNAAQFVQVLEHRQGVRIACLEEIALRMGFIDADSCYALGRKQQNSGYGQYVMTAAQAG